MARNENSVDALVSTGQSSVCELNKPIKVRLKEAPYWSALHDLTTPLHDAFFHNVEEAQDIEHRWIYVFYHDEPKDCFDLDRLRGAEILVEEANQWRILYDPDLGLPFSERSKQPFDVETSEGYVELDSCYAFKPMGFHFILSPIRLTADSLLFLRDLVDILHPRCYTIGSQEDMPEIVEFVVLDPYLAAIDIHQSEFVPRLDKWYAFLEDQKRQKELFVASVLNSWIQADESSDPAGVENELRDGQPQKYIDEHAQNEAEARTPAEEALLEFEKVINTPEFLAIDAAASAQKGVDKDADAIATAVYTWGTITQDLIPLKAGRDLLCKFLDQDYFPASHIVGDDINWKRDFPWDSFPNMAAAHTTTVLNMVPADIVRFSREAEKARKKAVDAGREALKQEEEANRLAKRIIRHLTPEGFEQLKIMKDKQELFNYLMEGDPTTKPLDRDAPMHSRRHHIAQFRRNWPRDYPRLVRDKTPGVQRSVDLLFDLKDRHDEAIKASEKYLLSQLDYEMEQVAAEKKWDASEHEWDQKRPKVDLKGARLAAAMEILNLAMMLYSLEDVKREKRYLRYADMIAASADLTGAVIRSSTRLTNAKFLGVFARKVSGPAAFIGGLVDLLDYGGEFMWAVKTEQTGKAILYGAAAGCGLVTALCGIALVSAKVTAAAAVAALLGTIMFVAFAVGLAAILIVMIFFMDHPYEEFARHCFLGKASDEVLPRPDWATRGIGGKNDTIENQILVLFELLCKPQILVELLVKKTSDKDLSTYGFLLTVIPGKPFPLRDYKYQVSIKISDRKGDLYLNLATVIKKEGTEEFFPNQCTTERPFPPRRKALLEYDEQGGLRWILRCWSDQELLKPLKADDYENLFNYTCKVNYQGQAVALTGDLYEIKGRVEKEGQLGTVEKHVTHPMLHRAITHHFRTSVIYMSDEPQSQEICVWPESAAIGASAYGGFTLREGNNDKNRMWDRASHNEPGEYVKELQNDLVKLGYWISHPDKQSGMYADGEFGPRVKAAVVLFQREHELEPDGVVGPITSDCIKQAVSEVKTSGGKYQRPGLGTTSYGRFYQLPPLKTYYKYQPNYDSNQIMNDNWGTERTVNMLVKVAQEWKTSGKAVFWVGDMSKYSGGPIGKHGLHRDGTSVDLDSNRCCSINKATFNKEEALVLAEKLMKHGAKRILFNCKYVIDKCPGVWALKNHHHHFHVDIIKRSTERHAEQECRYCKYSVYKACNHQLKPKRKKSELTP